MVAIAPQTIKLWEKGQMTIPKGMRQALRLGSRTVLNAFVVGNSIILTPKQLLGPPLAREFQRAMKKQGLTLKDLLKSLKEERRRTLRERYGP